MALLHSFVMSMFWTVGRNHKRHDIKNKEWKWQYNIYIITKSVSGQLRVHWRDDVVFSDWTSVYLWAFIESSGEHLDLMCGCQVHLHPQSKLREKRSISKRWHLKKQCISEKYIKCNSHNVIHKLTSRLWVQAFLDQLPVWILKNKYRSFIKISFFKI